MIKGGISIGMNGSMLDEHPTGTGVYSFNLINHLAKLGTAGSWQPVTVFTPTGRQLDKDLHIVKIPGLMLSSRYGKIAALSRFLWNTFYYPIQARKMDLLISPTTHGSFTLKNQIITIHDLISLRYDNISAHQRFYFRYFLPFLISRSKWIVAISEATRRDIVELLACPEDKIKVIYNGYDEEHYYKLEENKGIILQKYGQERYLLAVGPTYTHKNFETLIRTYTDLLRAGNNIPPLLIAGGKKAYLLQLKNLVNELDMQGKIHFLGYVPFEYMPSLYREADLLVFPSLYEGFGFPLLEAMACGCPVISSGTSSMPEVCGDAALYFDPLDKQDLANAMLKMLSDEHLRKEFISKGLQQVKKFSWKKTADSFKSLIETHFQSPNSISHVRH